MGRVTSRLESATIIVTTIHEVPRVQRLSTIIVKVGESEAMGIFVTDGAKSAVAVIIFQFRQGTIAINQIVLSTIRDGNGVTIDSLLHILQAITYPPLVRPYQVRPTTVVHTMTGIDDQQLIDVAIAIPVVFAPVDLRIPLEYIHDVLNKILRLLIMRIGAGILFGIATDLYIYQVEDKVELTIALVHEIVVYGPLERLLHKAHGIENLVP